jgi:membrane protein implicated in regulation of membrane protease activity
MNLIHLGIDSWWHSIAPEIQIFYAIGILAFFALVLQTALLLIGHGHEDAHHGGEAGHSLGSAVFSIKGVTATAFGFGWGGAILLHHGWPVWAAAIAGGAAGLLLAFAYVLALRSLRKLESTGNFQPASVIGLVGVVYLAVPPKGDGHGEVVVTTKDHREQLRAYNRGDQGIPAGADVRVLGLRGTGVEVEPLS